MELKAPCVCVRLCPIPTQSRELAVMPAGPRRGPGPSALRGEGRCWLSPAPAQNCLRERSFSVSPLALAPELLPALSGPVSSLWSWKPSVFPHGNEQQNLQRNTFFRILIFCLTPSLNLYLSLYVRREKQQDPLRWCLCRSHCSGRCWGLQAWNITGQAGRVRCPS